MTIKAFTAGLALVGFLAAAPALVDVAERRVYAEAAGSKPAVNAAAPQVGADKSAAQAAVPAQQTAAEQVAAAAPVPTVTVAPGDTLSTIATAHQTTYVRIYNANDKIQHPDVIHPGEVYRIPAAEEALPERPLPGAAVAPAAVQTAQPRAASTAPAAAARPSMNVAANKQALMAQAGIAESDFGYADYIISKESGWNATIANKKSGAYGLCQALPGNKMASAGGDWAENPVTQLRWCNSYAVSRYGSWANAYNTWLTKHWW